MCVCVCTSALTSSLCVRRAGVIFIVAQSWVSLSSPKLPPSPPQAEGEWETLCTLDALRRSNPPYSSIPFIPKRQLPQRTRGDMPIALVCVCVCLWESTPLRFHPYSWHTHTQSWLPPVYIYIFSRRTGKWLTIDTLVQLYSQISITPSKGNCIFVYYRHTRVLMCIILGERHTAYIILHFILELLMCLTLEFVNWCTKLLLSIHARVKQSHFSENKQRDHLLITTWSSDKQRNREWFFRWVRGNIVAVQIFFYHYLFYFATKNYFLSIVSGKPWVSPIILTSSRKPPKMRKSWKKKIKLN